jgi:alkanesulfonate monooxygenase SsuD/methylene tetrahydromethanopterin reductase-like flavin-dependent oxidoreductase (luciferase family)
MMRFGVDVPTCLAGMAYPVPFAGIDDVVRIAVEAEQLGYHEVSGNDHLSTQRFVREAWPAAPDYFEPLVTLAAVAVKTSVVRLATGILVLPMRDPVLLAKQVATLDHLSGGRVTLAVAVGGYRDEFEAVAPSLRDASRADLAREGIEALDLDAYVADNLIGTPDEVCAKVAEFERAGLDQFGATLFVADTVEEMLDQMRAFARYVLPAFPERR